jgi:cytoplasmic iron level regulating protein YaaA (DUF328/UPF0246 family)
MGTKLPVAENKNLWILENQDNLNKELKDGGLFVNLASNEYFRLSMSKR